MTVPQPTPPPEEATLPAIVLDWEEWLPMIAESEGSDAEKRKIIEAVWQIMLAAADLKLPIKAHAESGGKDIDLCALLAAAVVNSEHNPEQTEEMP